MKKIFSTTLLGLSIMGFSQVSISGKANVLIETNSARWKDLKSSVQNSGSKSMGFNVGLSAKIDIPSTPFFVMPEAYYTTFTNSYKEISTGTQLKAKAHRVDVPILGGINVISDNVSLFIGPVFSYNLTKEGKWNDFKENAGKKFTAGYQIGAQLLISKLILNARYEGRFTSDQRDYINNNISKTVRYDYRPNLLILGLGYQF